MSFNHTNTSFHSHSDSLNSSFMTYYQQNPVQFPLEFKANISFQASQDYAISIRATEENLSILLEERFDVNAWKAEYSSKYIEEICRKTGKERPFSVFMQLLLTSIQGKKGSSQVYIDLLGYQDLQLLKARRGNPDENQAHMASQGQKNNKRYLILTSMQSGNKVHYPLPLNPVETGVYQLDKETMQQMVKKMSQTLTDFKQMSLTGNSGFQQSQTGFGRQTAKEFFSKENLTHPVVEENARLKEKLRMLEEVRSQSSSVHKVLQEKSRIEQDFQQYKTQAQSEYQRLKSLQYELHSQIDDVKSELTSQRPGSSYSESLHNHTLTSNFSTSALEELRRQLADQSIELEELKEQYKKKYALQQKDLEESYSEISTYRQEEKAMRVKVNQIEKELEMNLKRLDIICKSKGLPRPQRKTQEGAQRNYVSPYRQNGSQDRKQPLRNNSGSVGKGQSPFRNYNYTPPNKRNYSPSNLSNGSGFRGGQSNNYSPINLRNRQQSPGARSNASNNSKGSATQNRLYSPSGRVRGSQTNDSANRVRRAEQTTSSLNGSSRSGSRTKSSVPIQNARQNSGNRNQTQKLTTNNKYVPTTKAATQQIERKTLNTKALPATTILSQQKAVKQAGNIDDKIERLQSLLKMAK